MMATPLTADQITAALRAEGVRLQEHRSWRTHNRNHKGPWGPVNGVMIHHTVSKGDLPSVELCYNGYTGLLGPLCHSVIPKSGTVYLTSAGRSNHAGGGDPNVFAAVKDERYNDRPPVPRVGNADGMDGNAHFYGAECVNMGDGKDPWTEEQIDAIVRWAAALCRAHGWSAKSVIAHREWSKDKSDPSGPGMPTMPVIRARIKERLAHAASWDPTAPGPAPTTPTTGTGMPFYTYLSRPEDTNLIPGTPVTLYWTGEHADTGNEHGAGGKTVLSGGTYTGVLNLHLAGLPAGQRVRVYAIEEDANGNFAGASNMIDDVAGRGDGSETLHTSVAVSGRVWNRLSLQLVNDSNLPVTVVHAELSLHHWDN